MRKNKIIFVIIMLTSFNFSCDPVQNREKQFNNIEPTISSIHSAFEEGTLTAEELVKSYLKRIEYYDQSTQLNSIVVINPEAINEARLLDREYKQTGKLRSLHGIPVVVKDNYLTKEIQTTAGSLALKGYTPDFDAYQVKKLKEAGAIVLAKSNMAEWAFSPMVTISSIAGETRNPYNTDHVPAGSSGGTAAAVAANFVTVGLGTDTGNSIRGPSSHNALVGFRTTLGLISRYGIFPLYLRNDVGGPICRTVEDATRVLNVIAGYDPKDSLTKHAIGKVSDDYLLYLKKDGLNGARIGVLRALSENNPDPQVHELFENAIEDLQRLGATIVDPLEIPQFDSLRKDLWCPEFKQDINEFLALLGKDVPVKDLEEIVKSGKYSGYIEDNLNYFLELEIEELCGSVYTNERSIDFRNAIVNMMDSLDLGAIIYPTWNHPPAKIGDFEGYKGDNSQVIAPHTGLPAFTVPMGYTYDNLPAGLQFVGRLFDEPTLIRYTYSYEQGTKHRKPPINYPSLDESK